VHFFSEFRIALFPLPGSLCLQRKERNRDEEANRERERERERAVKRRVRGKKIAQTDHNTRQKTSEKKRETTKKTSCKLFDVQYFALCQCPGLRWHQCVVRAEFRLPCAALRDTGGCSTGHT
jgi:hypothetical protein